MKIQYTIFAGLLLLAGCSSEPKSVEFYKTHKEEREQMKSICLTKTESERSLDQDCVNVKQALSELRNTIYKAPTQPQKNVDDYLK